MPNPLRLQFLADLRKEVRPRLSQAAVAKKFGLSGTQGRKTVGDWELAKATPDRNRRTRFIGYLWDDLSLRSEPKQFDMYWQILVEEWKWEPISDEEWRSHFPGVPRPRTVENASIGQLHIPFQAPAPVPYFVGRSTLVQQVSSLLLQDGDRKIVGLVGLGGIGKTAIATQLVYAVRDWFPDGILWADLQGSTLESQANVESELISFAAAFGQAERVGELKDLPNKAQFVRNILLHKRLLVVIDNVENAEDLGLLLPSGNAIQTLITTRNRKLLNELNAEIVDVPVLDDNDSMELLMSRIGQQRVEMEKTAAGRIIEYVGGLPLALSVAAGYLQEIVEMRLTDYAALLQDEKKRVTNLEFDDEESRIVYSTFELSYGILTPAQRDFFASLGLFDGPDFDNQAAAALNEVAPMQATTSLARLASFSLLNRGIGERSPLIELQNDDSARFQMHALVKSFALSKLDVDNDALHRRLADYFVSLTQEHAQPNGYRILDFEWQNILGTLQWAYRHNQYELLANGALALTRNNAGKMGFMEARGHWSAARTILGWASEQSKGDEDKWQRVQIISNQGGFAVRQSDFDMALPLLNQSLEMLEKLPANPEVLLQKLTLYDFMARMYQHESLERAIEWLERGQSDSASSNDEPVEKQRGYLKIRLSEMLTLSGNATAAAQMAKQGLDLVKNTDLTVRLAGLINLGAAYQHLSRAEEAMSVYEEAMQLATQLNDVHRTATLRLNMAWNKSRTGQLREAIADQEKALSTYQYMGDALYESGIHINLGSDYTRLGDYKEAQAHLEESIQLSKDYQLQDNEALAKANLAELFLKTGQIDKARELLDQTRQLTDSLDLGWLLPTLLRLQAETMLALSEVQAAQALINKAIEMAQAADDQEELGICWRVQGSILAQAGSSHQALNAWQRSLSTLAELYPYELAMTKLSIAQGLDHLGIALLSTKTSQNWADESLEALKRLGLAEKTVDILFKTGRPM